MAAAGMFAAWVILGWLLVPPANLGTNTFRFAIIQPNVPQDNRMDWTVRQRYRDWLTLRDITVAAYQDATNPLPLDAIIWPEGFVPGWTLDPIALNTERDAGIYWNMNLDKPDDAPELNLPLRITATEIVDQLLILQEMIDVPMIVGSVAYDDLRIVDEPGGGIEYKYDAMYNSAFVIENGQVNENWYDKLHLTPFGEVMPYISTFDWLEQQLLALGANGMDFVLEPGAEPRNLEVSLRDAGDTARLQVATPICFEATISNVCRRLVCRNGKRVAGVMINMTNDGWFGNSIGGRAAHLQIARWRAIELATPMIRCANTGISCVIDHRGQIINKRVKALADDPLEGYLIGQAQMGAGLTVFSRIGDAFGWLTFLLTMAWGGFAIFRRSKDVQPMTEVAS